MFTGGIGSRPASSEVGNAMKNTVLAKHIVGASAAFLLSLPLMDCGSTPDTVGSGTPGGGGGSGTSTAPINLPDASAGGPSGNGGSGGPSPTSDAHCGVQTSNTTKDLTDVLLVLDRSGSMSESIAEDCCCNSACTQASNASMCKDTSNCTERWPALTSAVNTTIAQTTGINWGLKFFTTPPTAGSKQSNSCAVSDGVEVGIGAGSASQIATAISTVSPGANTPTASAIAKATTYLQTIKDQNNKVILLATDGEPNCKGGSGSNSDVPGTEQAIADALTAGFKVYVIGIGPSVGNLDNFAQKGGTDKSFPATSAADLANALASISKAVASCTFTVTAPPQGADPNNIAVYLDGTLLAKDPANGWSFGASTQTVTLNGTDCNDITSGKATKVQVYFGCPDQPPPTQILF